MISFGPLDEAPVALADTTTPVAPLGGDVPSILKNVLQPGDVYMDVGARNGVNTVLLAAQLVGTMGRVVALEPDPTKFARLLHNVALNRVSNTMCFPVAASDETIHATLFREFPRGPLSPPARHIRVQRVDDLCAKLGHNKVRLIKVDAPGSELLVLRGICRLFHTEYPPAVLCVASKWAPQAVNNGRDALINFMADFGYVPKQLGSVQITRLPGTAPQVRFMLWFSKPHAVRPH